MDNDLAAQKHMLLDMLAGLRESQDAWHIQKEVAAWSAAALYIAGLLAIAGFIFDKSINSLLMLCLFFAVILIGYSFIVFIHSHYSSVYLVWQSVWLLIVASLNYVGKVAMLLNPI